MPSPKEFLNEKLIVPLRQLSLGDGAACVLIGLVGGLTPIPAVTTVATVALTVLCGFSTPQTAVSTAINLILTPVQILCILPFAAAGRSILLAACALLAQAGPEAWLHLIEEVNTFASAPLPSTAELTSFGSFSDFFTTFGLVFACATFSWLVFASIAVATVQLISQKRIQ